MSTLYSLCPHSDGLKFKTVLTKILVQVHTHTHTHTHTYRLHPTCSRSPWDSKRDKKKKAMQWLKTNNQKGKRISSDTGSLYNMLYAVIGDNTYW